MTSLIRQEKFDISLPIQLLVEGNDQRNFFDEMLKILDFNDSIQVQSFGGTQDLRKFLRIFKRHPKFDEIVKRIGVIRDAEANFNAAFSSVQSSLANAELPVPELHGVFTKSPLPVGVMILPGESQNGMLETLLCKIISDCRINACIDKFFECIKCEAGIHVKRTDKARARVFITTQPEPHVSVGVAAKKGYWDLNHDEFTGVRNFLLELASLDSH